MLFLRSLERSERVYQAMLARGWNGEGTRAAWTPLGGVDVAVLASVPLLLIALRVAV